jgi:hypothetical protein
MLWVEVMGVWRCQRFSCLSFYGGEVRVCVCVLRFTWYHPQKDSTFVYCSAAEEPFASLTRAAHFSRALCLLWCLPRWPLNRSQLCSPLRFVSFCVCVCDDLYVFSHFILLHLVLVTLATPYIASFISPVCAEARNRRVISMEKENRENRNDDRARFDGVCVRSNVFGSRWS